jgi:hypothetical protein
VKGSAIWQHWYTKCNPLGCCCYCYCCCCCCCSIDSTSHQQGSCRTTRHSVPVYRYTMPPTWYFTVPYVGKVQHSTVVSRTESKGIVEFEPRRACLRRHATSKLREEKWARSVYQYRLIGLEVTSGVLRNLHLRVYRYLHAT